MRRILSVFAAIAAFGAATTGSAQAADTTLPLNDCVSVTAPSVVVTPGGGVVVYRDNVSVTPLSCVTLPPSPSAVLAR